MGDELEAVVGLEIHVQLATRTKMFCGCELSFGDEPNVHTCPICLAHPGVLPVPNEEAIAYALKIGLALDCEIAPRSIFHRKNYFYPDNPKAYQISQYDIPICGAGKLGEIRITRAHLEEDAAKTIHAGSSGRIHGSTASLVSLSARPGAPSTSRCVSCRRFTTAAGMPAGPSVPYHCTASKPLKPISCSVGTSFSCGLRRGPVTASARMRPARTCGRAVATLGNMAWVWPPSRSFIAGAAPR